MMPKNDNPLNRPTRHVVIPHPLRQWLLIELLDEECFGQKIIYYCPPITDSAHPSNNKGEYVADSRPAHRKVTHFMLPGRPGDDE